jgi:hypothetical protein
MHDAAVVHHGHGVAELASAKRKFCSTSRIVVAGALQLAEGARSCCR